MVDGGGTARTLRPVRYPTATSGAQSIHGNRVEWSWSVWCPGCGSAVEICGWGEVPDQVRAAIITRDGPARLRAIRSSTAHGGSPSSQYSGEAA